MSLILTILILTSSLSHATTANSIPDRVINPSENCQKISYFDEQTLPYGLDLGKKSIDLILISKAKRKIYLIENGQVLKKYPTTFGSGYKNGHKTQEGDGRTPEGIYKITNKNLQSQFYKSLGVSYPNSSDKAYAAKYKVNPGGSIMIHGMSNKLGSVANNSIAADLINSGNWTQGCIAVRNDYIDEIFSVIKVGTLVDICPL